MLLKIKYLIYLILFLPNIVTSQKNISFIAKSGDSNFLMNENNLILNDTITISVIKFYISKVNLLKDSIVTFKDDKLGYLIDLSQEKTKSINFTHNEDVEFNRINFQLGIDSSTHMEGVKGDDLDPTNGMYWTWKSGYINFKMEGFSLNCPARNNYFQFHIGGYQYPFNSTQEIDLSIKKDSAVNIVLDIETIFKEINLTETYEIMSPSQSSLRIANLIKSSFYIK